MSPHDFCYWLNGFLEIANPKELNKDQLEVVKKHLSLVFEKVTSESSPAKKSVLTDAVKSRTNYDPGKRYC